MNNTHQKFTHDADLVKSKITQYNEIIANDFFALVSVGFKKKIKSQYGDYLLLNNNEILDQILENSNFKKNCFSNIEITTRENDLFWINALVKDLERIIDFDKLKEIEQTKIKSIPTTNTKFIFNSENSIKISYDNDDLITRNVNTRSNDNYLSKDTYSKKNKFHFPNSFSKSDTDLENTLKQHINNLIIPDHENVTSNVITDCLIV